MTQWVIPKRGEHKKRKRHCKNKMTHSVDSESKNGKREETTEIADESGSDAGSDIFMPGGITMKATDIPSENSESTENLDDKEKHEERNSEINDNKELSETNSCNVSELNISCKKSNNMDESNDHENIKANEDLDKMSESGSPSSCLEINMEDDEAFPCSKKEKKFNSSHRESNLIDERNIFMNISDILDTSDEKAIIEKEEKKENLKHSKNECDEDDNHMSEDFKIGLRQKSVDVDPFCPDTPLAYETIEGNIYLIDKKKSRSKEDRMKCECPFEPDDPCFVGCDDECLNRLLLIECSPRNCPTGEFCRNRNFQRGCKYNLEIFKAGKKGWGLRTNQDIQAGAFIMEYCGEVVNYDAFQNRTQEYHRDGISHYYFMTLKQNEIIDATKKGSKSRFINHSCDPNCETQKWTVNGFLRVGFFAVRDINAGDELSFDYQFQRYGEKAQDCFCGADNCRGVIGSEQLNSRTTYVESFGDYLNLEDRQMVDSPSQSGKKKKKGKQLLDSEIADELREVFNGKPWELREPRQMLEMLRLMVKVVTTQERILLLKIIQMSKDVNAMKAFVRYKGLSLLWSWMVDAPETKLKYRIEILKTLQMIPVPNRNELDDSNVEKIVHKWSTSVSATTSTNETAEKASLQDSPDDICSDNDTKNDEGGTSSQDDSSKEDNDEVDTKLSKNCDSMEEGEIIEDVDIELKEKKKKKTKEDKSADKTAKRKEKILSLSETLISDWKSLKEVFRIPKKSQTPDRRQKDGNMQSPQHQPSEDKRSEEISEPTSTDDPSSTTDDTISSPIRDNRSYKKREWRKSPNQRNESRQNTDESRWNDDQKNDRRESRWGRDRRNSYDRDRRGNRGNDNDGDNDCRGGKWGRNRQWNDRNRNNRGSRDGSGNRMNNQRNNENNWNGNMWNSPHPPPPQPPAPIGGMPHQYGGDMMQPPIQGPVFPIMGQPTMMNQPQMSMLQQRSNIPMQNMNPLNVVLPNNQSSPLMSPMPNAPFNPSSIPSSNTPVNFQTSTSGQFNPAPAGTADVTTLSMVNQLLLLNAERLKQTQNSGSHNSTPDNNTGRNSTPPSPHRTSVSPTRSSKAPSLPPQWKTATDADGRVYYYHTITRETSWDPPIQSTNSDDKSPKRQRKNTRSSTDSHSPLRSSPRIEPPHKSGPRTPPSASTSRMNSANTSELQKIRDTFKAKISSVVVNCLNSYQKVDCKQGRIKNVDDFKFLARKLTHGLIMKERQRIGKEELLNCNDSVKLKVKEYIRNYMKKFGPFYIRS